MVSGHWSFNLNGLYQHKEDWERVARTSDRLLKISPETPEPLRDRGMAYRAKGEPDRDSAREHVACH